MSSTLPIPPYREPMIDEQGFLTLPWLSFMRMLFVRVGSQEALNNQELAVVQTAGISALQTTVTNLQTQVNTLSNTLTGDVSDLNQGQNL